MTEICHFAHTYAHTRTHTRGERTETESGREGRESARETVKSRGYGYGFSHCVCVCVCVCVCGNSIDFLSLPPFPFPPRLQSTTTVHSLHSPYTSRMGAERSCQ